MRGLVASLSLFALAGSATAADMPVKAPVAPATDDWTAF